MGHEAAASCFSSGIAFWGLSSVAAPLAAGPRTHTGWGRNLFLCECTLQGMSSLYISWLHVNECPFLCCFFFDFFMGQVKNA